MSMSFIISKNIEHSLEKTLRELMERFTNLTIIIIIIIEQIDHVISMIPVIGCLQKVTSR